jgi:hypothetical protein
MAWQWLSRLRGAVVRKDRGATPRPPKRQRIKRYFECNWVSDEGSEQTRVSSISPTGCFIDSRSSVPPAGTHLQEISVALPGGELTLEGTVIGATHGTGFAVRFTGVNREARSRLCRLVGVPA